MISMASQHEVQSAKPVAVLSSTADQPNLPEVSGTSFPLLTTVLAGFAVTIAVQLIIRPDPGTEISTRITAAIIIFLASTLVFISSIVFAVNAQAHNYLPFITDTQSFKNLLGFEDYESWIDWLHQGWDTFHLAAITTFYGGVFLLLAGVNLIVWEFVGNGAALIVLMLIVANVLLTLSVGIAIERRKRRTRPSRRLNTGTIDVESEEESVNPKKLA
jgi:hypothetical protein